MKTRSTFYRLAALVLLLFSVQTTFSNPNSKSNPNPNFPGKGDQRANYSAYGENVNDICLVGDKLWLATGGGLLSFNTETKEFSYFNKANSGLPANQVTTVCPYDLGKIAVGTPKGVAIFDTMACQVFDGSNSPLKYNYIQSKMAWIQGNLYVASVLRLFVFSQPNWKTIYYGTPVMSNPDYISAIKSDSRDSIFVLKANGIFQVTADKLVGYYSGLRGIRDFTFVADTLWMATCNGLFSYRDTLIQYLGYNKNIQTLLPQKPFGPVFRMKTDSQKRIWLLTPKGLTVFNTTTKTSTEITNDSINFGAAPLMEVDAQDNIWLVSKRPGRIWKFDGTTWTKWAFAKGLASNKIKNFLLDKRGNLWITNLDSCLSKYNGDSSTVYDSAFIHRVKPVKSLFKGKKRLIFFMSNDVIVDYSDSLNGSTIINPGYTNKFAHAVYDSTNGVFWKASRFGLEKTVAGVLDTIDIRKLGATSNRIAGLYLEKSGSLLISTFPDSTVKGQLLRFDGTSVTLLYTCKELSYWVSGIVTDADGNLWIGILDNNKRFGGGIIRIKGKTLTEFNTINSRLPGNCVSDLTLDVNGNLWIGTIGAGLAKFDRKYKWEVMNSDNSVLPVDTVDQIVVDAQSNAWVATVDGGITYLPSGAPESVTAISIASATVSDTPEIYPVPCTTEVNIRFSDKNNNKIATITLFNLAGQKVLEAVSAIPDSRLVTLPVNNLPKGMYLLKVADDLSNTCKMLMVK